MEIKLARLINLCLERNIPFVVYRLPEAEDVMVRIQRSGNMLFLEDVEELAGQSGFVYAPFHRNTNLPVVLFEPEYISLAENIEDSIIRDLDKTKPLYPDYEFEVPFQVEKADYLRQVEKIMKSFGPGLSKTVLSRVIIHRKPPSFHAGSFFLNLVKTYPAAFCHLINIPGAGCWAGATPEVLFRSDGQLARTESLAGTQEYNEGEEITWSEKEIEEQEMVTRFVESVLRESGVAEFSKEKAKTVKAGKVVHLSTRFQFSPGFASFDAAVFIDRLHPTPAICGFPREPALKLIMNTEKHNREYYTGFCGPFNDNGNTDLFVNLRCMKILPGCLAVFAGGGITARSVPQAEWKETEWKAKTLLSLI